MPHLKKNMMLPIAFAGGVIFHNWMGYLTFLSPYLIFAMLFITYCKLKLSDFRPGKFETTLLLVQYGLSGLLYLLLLPVNSTLAQGVFCCVFVPTATAAPVITSMLGGSISRVVTYSLMGNLVVATIGPVVLAAVGEDAGFSFVESFGLILAQVVPLLLGPLVLAFIFRRLLPGLHSRVVGMQQLSFYLWAIALFIIVGSCVSYAIRKWTPGDAPIIILLAAGAIVACLLQFIIGRRIGARFGDTIAGGQSLMQKNTVLGVWLAMTYLNPLASLGPAAYIACQNILNSWQLMRR